MIAIRSCRDAAEWDALLERVPCFAPGGPFHAIHSLSFDMRPSTRIWAVLGRTHEWYTRTGQL